MSPEGDRNMIPYKLNLDKYKIREDLAIRGKGGADIRPIYGPSLWISEKTLGRHLTMQIIGMRVHGTCI